MSLFDYTFHQPSQALRFDIYYTITQILDILDTQYTLRFGRDLLRNRKVRNFTFALFVK